MILVTGANGLIGAHVVVHLIRQGKRVRAFVRQGSSLEALHGLLAFHQLSNDYELFHGDVNDPITLNEAVEGCEATIHCAAMVSFSKKDRHTMFRVNVQGTENVVDACLGAKIPLGFVSSTAAIGDLFRGEQEGLNVTIVNPGIVIGPGKRGQSSTSIFMFAEQGATFYPPGGNGFVDVRDVAEILITSLEQIGPAERLLLIGENATFKTVFSTVAQAHSKKEPSVKIPSGLIRAVATLTEGVERIGLNLPLNSEGLKASATTKVYSNKKASERGFVFRSIEEAVDYTKEAYFFFSN